MDEFRFPDRSHRLSIIGRTGSGKTQAGFFFLSFAHFDKQPYIIFDYKGDELLNSVDGIKEIGLHEKIPKQPGLFILHPHPTRDAEAVEDWMWRAHGRGEIGLYFDEGYMLPSKGALQSIVTQGRSLKIPVITLTQRPVRVDPFVFSESDFFAVFHLNRRRDVETAQSYLRDGELSTRLPPYHFVWYDVSRDVALSCSPVWNADRIRDRIITRLRGAPRKTRFL